MNWLMYIGGGFAFVLIGIGFLVSKVNDKLWQKKSEKDGFLESMVILGIFLSPILIWIWICWRFIA